MSTSSITNTFRLLMSKLGVLSRWYSRRPGVAITMLANSSWFISSDADLPPDTSVQEKSCYFPTFWSNINTWVANSLVGTKIIAPVLSSLDHLFRYKHSTSGISYANVFPLPVTAPPRMSLSAKEWGMLHAWISVRYLKLFLFNPLRVGWEIG